MSKWPRDNQSALIKFYGDPETGEVARQLVKVIPPFKMYYDGRLLSTISFHKKAAPALMAALTKVWDYYGRDQVMVDKLGISKTAGTYNPRKIRGQEGPDGKWSNHAYGAAIDINAQQNGFNVVGNIPIPMIAAFKSEGFKWGGDYKNRKDPMHFEACDSGEPARTFEQWLKFYKVAPKVLQKTTVAAPLEPRGAQVDEPDKIQEDFAKPEAVKPIETEKPAVVASIIPAVVQPKPANGIVYEGGDEVLKGIQRRLKACMYDSGGIDGIWGTFSRSAISGFINDRELDIVPPKTMIEFQIIAPALAAELSEAESEDYKRPMLVERKEATPAAIAPKIPEVDASIKAERIGFWASITGGVTTAVTAVGNYISENVSWLTTVKDFLWSLPWPAWVGLGFGVSFLVWYISFKSGQAKNAATQAYKEGSRT